MKRAISGVQPSGKQMLIGNYIGAVKQFVEFQRDYEGFYCIVNYHALTTMRDGKKLAEQTLEVATEYLACGLDPKKSVLFFQSDVPELTELTWIFNCITPFGLLERAHAYKDAVANGKDPSAGLFDYPVLMAADILIYKSNIVPVGTDQKQHVEIARDVAEKFNHIYGEVFPLPDSYIPVEVAVSGLDGRKMSKSYGNAIDLFEDEKDILKKVKGIVTDSKGVEEAKDPETDNVFKLYKLFAQENELVDLEKKYRDGGIGYGKAKEMLFEVMMRELRPLRERYTKLSQDKGYVLEVMKEGGKKARAVAQDTMVDVRNKVGLI